MVRGFIFVIMAIVVVLASAMFAHKNPGTVEVDLIVQTFEPVKSIAFVLTLAVGWLLGIATASLYLLKTVNEKRKLKKNIKMAEVELKNLRSLPMQDAG
ncbi:MAG: hypothetical protein AB8G18_04565 [Gammaproteobacteria bacterium]